MGNEPSEMTLEAEIADLRSAVDDALASVTAKQEVDLPAIGEMVESLTKRLQAQIQTMSPDERDIVLGELTQIVSGFSSLEETIMANAPLTAGSNDGVTN